MTTTIPAPDLIELTRAHAPPGREAAALNELLRSLHELLQPRPPLPQFYACRLVAER